MVSVTWMMKPVDTIDKMSDDLVRIHLAEDPENEFYLVNIDDILLEDTDD